MTRGGGQAGREASESLGQRVGWRADRDEEWIWWRADRVANGSGGGRMEMRGKERRDRRSKGNGRTNETQ